MSDSTDPLGEGETVYATDPSADVEPEDKDWPDHTDPEWLHYQYHMKGKNQIQMAEVAEVNQSVISVNMSKFGIQTIDNNKAKSISLGGDELLWDSDWLREKYVDEGLSTYEIAEDRGVNNSTVYKSLKRCGIEPTSQIEASSVSNYNRHEGAKYRDRSWLEFQYWDRLKSCPEIADGLGVSGSTIGEWMSKHNIPTRSISEALKLKSESVKTTLNSDGQKREFVAKDKNGNVVLDHSWQYFHERPAAERD